jgi:hypothetical protein
LITNLVKEQDSINTIVTCNVEGKPIPDIVWYLGKERLPQNAKYPAYSVTRESKLSVPIGSLENNTFLCNASNPQSFDVYHAKGTNYYTSFQFLKGNQAFASKRGWS